MRTLKNIHPGEVLKEEFLEPMGISVYRLDKETGLFTNKNKTDRKWREKHYRRNRSKAGQVFQCLCGILDEPPDAL